MASENEARIITMVCQIPSGSVATYGQIAKLAGIPKNSRQVGSILRDLPTGDGVPWYRVVNSKGEISQRGNGSSEKSQREVLEDEGVQFNENGRIDLKRFQWRP